MKKLFETVFSEYYKDIYYYLYSFSKDASLSEDLASETFLEALKSYASFREQSDVKTWLFSIARHCWFRYLKKKGHEIEFDSIDENETRDDLPANNEAPEEAVIRNELRKRIDEILGEFPEKVQKTVRLRSEGYSFYEIGQKLGISENSARVTEFRTRTKIREQLKKEGFEFE